MLRQCRLLAAGSPQIRARWPSRVRNICSVVEKSPLNDQQRISRWSLRISHDNTFLSYHRNAIIATVAGGSLIQYRQQQDRPPLAGTCLLAMGGLYMYVGSSLYVWQIFKLRKPLRLGPWTIFWGVFNASWPLVLWTLSLACLLESPPPVLLDSLRLIEDRLPSALYRTLFLDPPVRTTCSCSFVAWGVAACHAVCM